MKEKLTAAQILNKDRVIALAFAEMGVKDFKNNVIAAMEQYADQWRKELKQPEIQSREDKQDVEALAEQSWNEIYRKYLTMNKRDAYVNGYTEGYKASSSHPVSPVEEEKGLNIEAIKKAMYQFKKERLPDAESAFHHEAEIWAGMQSFIRWLTEGTTTSNSKQTR